MKNPYIELYRFGACILIALFHFEWCFVGHPVYLNHMYIFVEFFFLVSGYFFASNIHKNGIVESGWCFIKKRVKKIYPLYITAYVFALMAEVVNKITPIEDILNRLWDTKWEIALLQMSGLNYGGGG